MQLSDERVCLKYKMGVVEVGLRALLFALSLRSHLSPMHTQSRWPLAGERDLALGRQYNWLNGTKLSDVFVQRV